MDFDASAQVDALAKLPPEPPKPAERSAWTVVPRAVASGAGKVGAAIVEGVAALSPSEDDLQRNPGRTAFSAEDLGLTARSARDYERTLRPDPVTASTAEQVIYGVGSGLTQAGIGALVAGPAGAAAALGGGEGATVTDDLQRQGVDNTTARAAGAVTGAVNAASVALPMFGPTLKATAGLYLAGGPGGFMAQQALTSQILEHAGYDKIAEQFDPFDPMGLAMSALIPLPFAAYGARRVVGKSRAAGQIAADMAAGRAPDGTPIAQPEVPTVPRETVDAAMVHNLTLQRQAQDAVPPAVRAAMDVPPRPAELFPNSAKETAPVGSYIELPYPDMRGKPVAQILEVKPQDLYLPELDASGRLQPEKRSYLPGYVERLRAGEVAPTIDAVQMEDGRVRVVDGHRRAMAAIEAGAETVRVSVSPLINTAEDGMVPMTVELARAQGIAIGRQVADAQPAPPPAPKPDPAPAALAETIAKAQEELTAFQASGKTLDEYVTGKELPPAVNNLLIGLAETIKSPAKLKALLDIVGKSDAKADPANVTADAVEKVRTLTDAELTNTPPDTTATKPDALMQSVADRVAAVELTNPDMVIGMDDSGNPITVRDELARIRKEAMEGTDTTLGSADADLVNVAANCALTNGG